MKNVSVILTSLILSLLFPTCLKAQEELEHQSPTLQLGLNGITLNKGTLDKEIIMQIIADKQREIGLKIIQNMFLSKMDSAGGSFYSFTDNVIRGVIAEKDPDVIVKKILENTLNIAFTYAYADFYTRQLLRPSNAIELNSFKVMCSTLVQLNLTDNDVRSGLLGIRDPAYSNTSLGGDFNDSKGKNLIALIVDMSSEAIRNDPNLKQLGVMQVSYSQSYEFMNRYNILKRTWYAGLPSVDAVYNNMTSTLADFTSMIGLLYFNRNANTYRLNSTQLFRYFSDTISNRPIDVLLNTSKSNLQDLFSDIQTSLQTNNDTTEKRQIKEDLKLLSDYINYINKAGQFATNHPLMPTSTHPARLPIYSDIVFTLYGKIIPELRKMSIWNSAFIDEAERLEEITRTIFNFYLADVTNKLNDPWITNNLSSFKDILSRVYQFDKAETFSTSVALLADLEKIFPNSRIKDALAFINTYIRDFVKIKKDDKGIEYVDFNIESFLVKMSMIKPDKLRNLNFMFTVGSSSIWFDTKVKLEDGNEIKNFSFISEKIGVKFKIVDNGFWMTRNPGESYMITKVKDGVRYYKYTKYGTPKEPVISNVYIGLYGSGILYNILNTSTSNNYEEPLIGGSLGINFFNNLDFAFTIGSPIPKEGSFMSKTFFGFGFDFPFVEYLNKVNEKRKDNQNKKILVKLNE